MSPQSQVLEFLWGAGGKVVVHVCLTTVTRVRFRLCAVKWLKLPWSHVIGLVQFDFTKHRRFSPGSPVSSCSNTLDLWGMTLTGPLEKTAQVADRVIQYKHKSFTFTFTLTFTFPVIDFTPDPILHFK